jgi:hypothetical protein
MNTKSITIDPTTQCVLLKLSSLTGNKSYTKTIEIYNVVVLEVVGSFILLHMNDNTTQIYTEAYMFSAEILNKNPKIIKDEIEKEKLRQQMFNE